LILFPLNLIRDLSALGFTSILGLFAVAYTVLFIVYRSIDGSYSIIEPLGKFVKDNIIVPPNFDQSTMWNMDLRALVLVSNLGLAFIAHYNGPSYWRELKHATTQRFTILVSIAYAILALLYSITMSAGYATFGDTSRGNLLLNYHPSDLLATLGRLATGLSVIFGFPLVSNGAREGLKHAAAAHGYTSLLNDPDRTHGPLVVGMLIAACFVAIRVQDIKIIAGLSGAAMGSFLVYICPSLVYTRIVAIMKGVDSKDYKLARWNLLFVPFGLSIAMLGVTQILKHL